MSHSQRASSPTRGARLSPLLANLVLDELDRELERRGRRFARYADDVVILVRSERARPRVRWGVSMRTRLAKLADYLRGWMGYFWIGELYRPIPEIDPWLGRRVRMCFWVPWRRRWTRIGNLLKLGVGREQAVSTGRSSHGPWHLSRTYATQLAMANEWLTRQGLLSFKDLWISFAYPR